MWEKLTKAVLAANKYSASQAGLIGSLWFTIKV